MLHKKSFIISPIIMGMIISVCLSMNVFAASNYAIYSSVSAAFDASQNIWVFFGTGDKTDPISAASHDRFYGIKDIDRSTTYTLSNLINIDSTTYTDSATGHGWVMNFATSEKMLSAPIVYDQKIYLTTYSPSSVPCEESGNAKLYVINYISGAGQFGGGARSTSIGTGVPSGAVISTNPYGGNYDVYVATSSPVYDTSDNPHTSQQNDPSPRYTKLKNLIYWRDNRVQ